MSHFFLVVFDRVLLILAGEDMHSRTSSIDQIGQLTTELAALECLKNLDL